jgi:hypothetical protein
LTIILFQVDSVESVSCTGRSAPPDDSSESDGHSPVPYGELDALRFKAELETAQRELEEVSKKAGIAELEWEDQRKQLLKTIDGTALKTTF